MAPGIPLKGSDKIKAKKRDKTRKIRSKCVRCLMCGKNISERRSLVRHLRKIHAVEPNLKKQQLKCSFNDNCTFMCGTNAILREHLKEIHQINIEEKILRFKRFSGDFEEWKQEEEVKTNACYVSYTGKKCMGSKKVYYLKCHRSGEIRTCKIDNERKRSRPLKGYTQCGVACPSSIRVSEIENEMITVLYYPLHLGHSVGEESIQYLKLNSREQEEIVGKLAQGEPIRKIVSDARKRKGMKLSRINLLQKRDVYNIKRKINYLEKESEHDGKMIGDWIETLSLDGFRNNPIVLYNPIEETKDYILVLIHHIQKIIYFIAFDGSIVYVKTKKGKPNVDFYLTTVSVICGNGDSYPIAFCISYKFDYNTVRTFFKIIRQNFGVIKASVFVSDKMSTFYLAWKNVMGECDCKLICTFDIEIYWEQKLTYFKCPVSKQKEAINQLKTLLEETNVNVFRDKLLKVLKIWENDEGMKLFAQFFDKYYAKNSSEWANCHRICSTKNENINNYLEPINNKLDSIYVKSLTDLKEALNRLLSFVRDACFLKLLEWDKYFATEKQREIEASHLESCKMSISINNGSEWVIKDGHLNYVVKRDGSNCDKTCKVFCEACDICTHNYNCVCSDFVTGFNICKHIHAVGILYKEKTNLDIKNLAEAELRFSAIKMAKDLLNQLKASELTKEKYDEIIVKIANISKDVKTEENQTSTDGSNL